MLNLTIMLRRLVTPTPTRDGLAYAWWYVKGGDEVWKLALDQAKFPFFDRRRVLREVDRRNRCLLETWDTQVYRDWLTGEGPGGVTMLFTRALAQTLVHINLKPIHTLMETR